MRKHISVIKGLLRSKMRGMILTIVISAIIGVGGYGILTGYRAPYFGVRRVESFLLIWAIIGMALCVLSCVELPNKKTNRTNLYRRLQISEWMIFVWDIVCNALMWALFRASAIIVVYVISLLTRNNVGASKALMIFGSNARYAFLPMTKDYFSWGWQLMTILFFSVGVAGLSVGFRIHRVAMEILAGIVIFLILGTVLSPFKVPNTSNIFWLSIEVLYTACLLPLAVVKYLNVEGSDSDA